MILLIHREYYNQRNHLKTSMYSITRNCFYGVDVLSATRLASNTVFYQKLYLFSIHILYCDEVGTNKPHSATIVLVGVCLCGM